MDDYFKKLIAKEKAKREFFESPDFIRLIDEFKRVAAPIGQEAVLYADEGAYNFTAEEFREAVESVFECLESESGKDGDFPVSRISYEGLDFEIMFGQGSSYSVIPQKSAKPNSPRQV